MRNYNKVGFIGLGVMGLPMASNLLKHGYELVVFDIVKERIAQLPFQERVIKVSSAKEVASSVDVVVLMLPNSPHVEQVITGNEGLLKGDLSSEFFIIDMSSISPVITRNIAVQLQERKVDFIDAPVSGGQIGAINGSLTIMVGGKKKLFEEAEAFLSAMGKNIIYCGEIGSGQVVKVVNQLMSAINLISMSEGFTLGVKAGVDPVTMREVINNGSGRCWALDNRMPVILDGNFEPGFTIDLHKKDIGLAVDMAQSLNVPLYATALTYELFKTAQAKGKGCKDNSAIINLYEELAGVKVRRKKEEE